MVKSFLRKIRSFKQIFPILKSEVDGFYKSDKEKLSYRTLMPCHTVEKEWRLRIMRRDTVKKLLMKC